VILLDGIEVVLGLGDHVARAVEWYSASVPVASARQVVQWEAELLAQLADLNHGR